MGGETGMAWVQSGRKDMLTDETRMLFLVSLFLLLLF